MPVRDAFTPARRKQLIVGIIVGALVGVLISLWTGFWLWMLPGIAVGLAAGAIMRPPGDETDAAGSRRR
ncbi:HPP family protein [Agromyces marinus]|uniref:HPP family protein n=1 Tax=Agromyces marinus TaxID=1389020 RepID=A0ABN6YDD5_9MICO|nr:HPP family protein [Agromyces marinus]UIP59553.1 hypothetical protein DSM26151_24640 [Agromyces marinus]BDZ55390.1 hypothetical protein GCM10025870_24630 [Agromyces marinus]